MKKKIIYTLIIILFLSALFSFIDYRRVKNNKKPLFTINIVNPKKKTQNYYGLFYKIKRNYNNPNENFAKSDNIYFSYFFIKTKIKYNFSEIKETLTFTFDESNTLLIKDFEDKNNNYYSSNIKNIRVDYKDNTYKFEHFIKRNILSIKDVLKRADTYQKDRITYSKIYYYDDFKIYKCNSEYKNDKIKTNYYMTYKNNAIKNVCKNKNCIFRKTYKVIKKLDNNDTKGTINIISPKDKSKKITVNINKEDYDLLEENELYDFLFNTKDLNSFKEIETIFKNSDIIKIEKNKNTIYNDLECI